MIGLLLLLLVAIWFSLSLWIANKINQFIWRQRDLKGIASLGRNLAFFVLTALLFFLPFMDQFIAYPKWQQLCRTTADFEWGPNMNAEKANGRELIVYGKSHEMTIFPNILVTYFSRQFKDAETGEVVLIMPHANFYEAKPMFEIPTAGGGSGAIFLSGCSTHDKGKLVDYLSKFNLEIIEYRN